MARRNAPQRIIDDAFPVRVRVPHGGFGQRLDDLHAWLRYNLPAEDYAHHAGASVGGRDALTWYFRRIEDAAGFLEAFPGLRPADGTAAWKGSGSADFPQD